MITLTLISLFGEKCIPGPHSSLSLAFCRFCRQIIYISDVSNVTDLSDTCQKLLLIDVNKIEEYDVKAFLIVKRSISRVLPFLHAKKT